MSTVAKSFDEALSQAKSALHSDKYRISKDNAMMERELLLSMCILLDAIRSAAQVGSVYSRVRAEQLSTSPIKIVDKEPNGYVRKITIVLDSAIGGPPVTARVSTSGNLTTLTGGALLLPTVPFDYQELEPNAELWAVASATINVHIIERA